MPDSVIAVLRGVDLILHAGDAEHARCLEELELVAPLVAVAGNCDIHMTGARLPKRADIEISGLRFAMTHYEPTSVRAVEAVDVWVHGHTHERKDDMLGGMRVVCPGSAVAPRDGLPPCIAIATISGGGLTVEFVDVD